MRLVILITITLLFSCKAHDYLTTLQIGKELGCTGEIGYYRTETKYSKIHTFNKYLELQIDCPNLFENFDTLSLRKAAAYRLFLKLNDKDKRDYQAIRVIFTDDLKSDLDTSNFFSMTYLQDIYNSEILVRKYFRALIDNDTVYLRNQFDKDEFGYTINEVDSVNRSFLEITKGKLDESRLYNWSIVDDENKRYKLLVFLTDSENNYSAKFQFALHDTLGNDKNIVSIKYKKNGG